MAKAKDIPADKWCDLKFIGRFDVEIKTMTPAKVLYVIVHEIFHALDFIILKCRSLHSTFFESRIMEFLKQFNLSAEERKSVAKKSARW